MSAIDTQQQVEESAVRALADSLRGEVLLPSDPSYEQRTPP